MHKGVRYRRRWQGATTTNIGNIWRRSNDASGVETHRVVYLISGTGR